MSTATLPQVKPQKTIWQSLSLFLPPVAICGSTLLAFLLLGYHPYAEDGGIYSAAIAAHMDPTLFPKEHVWVEGHTQLAWFAPAAASLLRAFHLPLEAGLLLLHILGLFATMCAVWRIAKHCYGNKSSSTVACLVFAIGAGLPVAGTSLYLIDPYVTARSFTTPLMLFAVAFLLEQRWQRSAAVVLIAAALHPLMAFWGTFLLTFLVVGRNRNRLALSLCVSGAALAATGVVFASAAKDNALLHTLALGRAYWFLSQWAWYEVFGALAPCMLLWLLARGEASGTLRSITRAACWTTGTAFLLALSFARLDAHTSTIAKYQPLRALHLVFAMFLVMGAGALVRVLPQNRRIVLFAALCLALTTGVVSMQQMLYSASWYLEVPGRQSRNEWVQAFAWIRGNTAKNDFFAIDADYNSVPGEDAQGFRAATLRSVLPDRAKDGGIASVMPSLAADWQNGVEIQTGLATHLDASREHRLHAMGVKWVVIAASTATHLPCPFRNNTVQVCRLML